MKQGLMADNNSFPSPRYFSGLLTRSLSDLDAEISPKSILDGRQMFNLGNNPFGYDRNCTNPNTYMDKKPSLDNKFEVEGIKLALHLDPIDTEEMVLFGTKLNIQSPLCPNSPSDFGIKTRDSQLLASFTAFGSLKEEKDFCRSFADGLSLKEMESSEDYTCVITHGANPKTTHIFDNCVVESCSVFGDLSECKRENQCSCYDRHSCNVDLAVSKDNYL